MSAPTLSPESNTFCKEALHWRYSSGTDAVFLGWKRGHVRTSARTNTCVARTRACVPADTCVHSTQFLQSLCLCTVYALFREFISRIETCSCAACPDGFHLCTSAQGGVASKGQTLLSLAGAFCDRDADCDGDDGFCEGRSQTGCIAAPTGPGAQLRALSVSKRLCSLALSEHLCLGRKFCAGSSVSTVSSSWMICNSNHLDFSSKMRVRSSLCAVGGRD
jgi:hypothetical protein